MTTEVNDLSNSISWKLSDYEVDADRGFLPASDPLDRLPNDFSPWEEIGRELPKLLMSGRVRSFIQTMPLVDATGPQDDRERRRAMVILSFLGHAYVWGEKETVSSIPACLARPWHQLAQMVGRPPVLSYASYALDNWRRLDPSRAIELGNIALLQNFLGGRDEEWFVVIHVAIEAKAGPALSAILTAQKAVLNDQPEVVEGQLAAIARTLDAMHEILVRMPERCDPYIYFRRVRPYIHGWANHPTLPAGMIYEGVEDYRGVAQSFRGETGAQSSIIPALDAALGIAHAEDMLHCYLKEMRHYMPPKHRAFIKTVETGPCLRDYVLRHRDLYPCLRNSYNAAVDGIELFRSTHLEYARNYIAKQNQGGKRNPADVGTGGTPFVPYLKKHRSETGQHKIG